MLKKLMLLGILGAVMSCTTAPKEQKEDEKMIGMPNPASVYCEKIGGKSEVRRDEQGNEYGICILKDGTEIDEWELYRKNH